MDEDIELNDQNRDSNMDIDVIDTTHSRIVERRKVEDVMEDSYLRYSMSVIVARALPDVRDGLKPVHRRILYVMDKMGIRPSSKTVKSAQIVGEVMGKYHPHGDSAIYDSMVRMAQPWSMRYMLVNGQGNFGSMDGDPPAAYRYTEAKMMNHAEALLADIDKDTVPFRDNYDGTRREPEVLPAKLPNLLLNGQMGIAVGMATNIPPHNLSEVVDAIIVMIDKPEATLDDLLEHIQGPDFPTGGIVYGKESIRTAFLTGKGGVVVRGVANIEEDSKGRYHIIITEIPYALNKESLILKLAELVQDKKIGGISDIRDETARGEVRIVIDLKRDAYPKKILNQLYKMTPLQTSFHYNMLALIDGIQPRILGLEDILREFLKHRKNVVRRRTEFELRKAEARAHILVGLTIALDNIDEVITTIRQSQTTDEAQTNLIKRFKLSVLQAKAILAMQLRTLAGLERKKIEDELAQLKLLIAELKAILADEKRILAIIREELEDIKARFGDERRTKIIPQELGKFSDEELIPNEQVIVTLTTGNYIKRSPIANYKAQHRGGKGKKGMTTKDEDAIQQLIVTNTHDYLLFFTNKGRVFRLKTYEVPQSGLNTKGQAIVNLLQLQPEETISTIIKTTSAKETGYLFMSTVNGVVKKTAVGDYANVRQSGLIAINIDEKDELKWVAHTSGEDEIIISTKKGQAIRFAESDVRPMGRTARGVRGVRLRSKDEVIGMAVVENDLNIIVISENGYGKRTKVAQFTQHKRGGLGTRAAVVNEKTGDLIAMKSLRELNDEIIMISDNGQTIRVALRNIPSLGRTTQGVRVMRLNAKDAVASVTIVRKADEVDGDEETPEESKDTEK
jgi:DNA gyrase subunit A